MSDGNDGPAVYGKYMVFGIDSIAVERKRADIFLITRGEIQRLRAPAGQKCAFQRAAQGGAIKLGKLLQKAKLVLQAFRKFGGNRRTGRRPADIQVLVLQYGFQ